MSYQALRDIVRGERTAVVVTWVGSSSEASIGEAPPPAQRMLRIENQPWQGSFGDAATDAEVRRAAEQTAETGLITVSLETGREIEVFVERFAPLPKLIIVGAVHVAVHLVHFAKRVGFRSIVVDAREVFATRERFPHADELHVGWPANFLKEVPIHDQTYCVFLTHDPKLDDPALVVAIRRGARYVGALGSKRTHSKRVESLRALGLEEEQIRSIHAPIGLDLGGRRPEEIALSIVSQLVAARYGKPTR